MESMTVKEKLLIWKILGFKILIMNLTLQHNQASTLPVYYVHVRFSACDITESYSAAISLQVALFAQEQGGHCQSHFSGLTANNEAREEARLGVQQPVYSSLLLFSLLSLIFETDFRELAVRHRQWVLKCWRRICSFVSKQNLLFFSFNKSILIF